MGDLFEIRGKPYGGRLGSTLSVGPDIREGGGAHGSNMWSMDYWPLTHHWLNNAQHHMRVT